MPDYVSNVAVVPYARSCFTALMVGFAGSSAGILIHPSTRPLAKIFIPMFTSSLLVGYLGALIAGAYGYLERPPAQEQLLDQE